MSTTYKTEYSREKNFDTMEKGVFNDFGDSTPAKQVLARQPEGDVYRITEAPVGDIITTYNEVAAVAVGSEQLIATYTVPAGKGAVLNTVLGSGDNIANFIVKINSNVEAKVRTWWADFNASIPLDDLKLLASDKIEVFVVNRGSVPTDFNGTIKVEEYDI